MVARRDLRYAVLTGGFLLVGGLSLGGSDESEPVL